MTKKIISLALSLIITSTACLMAAPQTSEAASPRRGPTIHHTHRPPAPPVMRRPPRPPRPPRHYHHHHSSRIDRAIAAAAIIAAILSAGR